MTANDNCKLEPETYSFEYSLSKITTRVTEVNLLNLVGVRRV